MSGALGRLGRWAAIHRDTVRLAWAGSAYSPRALNTRSPEAAGICLPLARSGRDPALPAIQGLIATAGAPWTRPRVTSHAEAAAKSLRPS